MISRSPLLLILLSLIVPGLAEAGRDFAKAIAVDPAENVYVTGSSEGWGTALDFLTIKRDMTGMVKWKARFNGLGSGADIPNALAVDSWGNVYVTGSSLGVGTALDFCTIKYNCWGAVQWIARFNGWANRDDVANAIAVDSAGNVYVTGSSQSSSGDSDFLTVKYGGNGAVLWSTYWSGMRGHDIARAIQVDSSGNVYVTGSSAGAGSGLDYATIKYNSSGALSWLARYNGPGNGDDISVALAIDPWGNVYVTGSSLGFGSSFDYATIRYNCSGVTQWIARYNGPSNSTDKATALALDGFGNVHVTGSSLGWGTVLDYATIKYKSTNGAVVWESRYNGTANGDDIANAITLDNSCNAYVTGTSLGWGGLTDFATIKYNATGVPQWERRFNGTGNAADSGVGIAVKSMSGNVYVTGTSVGAGTAEDIATVKYNANGDTSWITRFNWP